MRTYLAVIAGVLLTVASVGRTAHGQTLSISLHEDLRIGGDESAALEYLLDSPGNLVVDRQGRIFVSERELDEIRVYDADGRYLKTLGQTGKAPCEFGEISSMMIDRDGSLLVMDSENQRLTRFWELGEGAETYPWTGSAGASVTQMMSFGDGYLMLYGWTTPNPLHDGRLLHIHEGDLSRVTASFGRADRFYDLNTKLGRVSARGMVPGEWRAAVDRSGSVFFSPGAYDGVVYRLSADEGDDWSVDRLRGYRTDHPPYEELDVDHVLRDMRIWMFAAHTGRELVAGRSYNIDAGLVVLPSNDLLHFVLIPPDGDTDSDERVMLVQQFDPTGKFVGYGHLKTSSTAESFVEDVDGEGRLYLIEHARGAPSIVRRVRLDISRGEE